MRYVALILGLVGAGVIGAVLANVIFPPPAPVPADSQAPSRLIARLDDLEKQVSRLSDEVRENRALPSPEPSESIPPGTPAAREEGEPGFTPAPDEEVIEDKVRKVVLERERAAVERRKAAAAVKQADQLSKWLDRWTTELDLSKKQREELGDNYRRRLEAIAAHQEELRERGADITEQERQILAQEMADTSRILDDELKKTLSTEQYEKMMSYYRKRQR